MLSTHALNSILSYYLLNKKKQEFRRKDNFKKERLGKAKIKMKFAHTRILSSFEFVTPLSNHSRSESDYSLNLTFTRFLKKCGE